MSAVTTTRAPGKLVVMGEYAVLAGHAGIVAAVDVYANATRGPGQGIAFDDGGLLRACIDESVDGGFIDGIPDDTIAVDTVDFRDADGRKFGLGSSAAVCVSFLRALVPQLQGDDDGLHALAQRAHRRFQHGKGSGIDVAASVYGGLVHFRRCSEVADDVWGSRLPMSLGDAGVGALAVWSGHSQDTRDFVKRCQSAWEHVETASATAAAIAGIADATGIFLKALADGDQGRLLASVSTARLHMSDLGQVAGADIVSAPHRAIALLAATHGGTAKPSGAGGGDVALAFAPLDTLPALRVALIQGGFPVLPLSLGADV
jgi:phosphomevalonate kinase